MHGTQGRSSPASGALTRSLLNAFRALGLRSLGFRVEGFMRGLGFRVEGFRVEGWGV